MNVRSARARARVLLSAVVTAVLAIGSIAGSAAGGNTRVIYFGDPDGTSNAVVRLSPVSVGNQTGFRVLVRNDGKQNVTHVVVAVGSDAATAGNQPPGPSIPAGSSVVTMFGQGTCTVEADRSGASCAVASLPSRATLTDTIVLNTPSVGQFDVWVSVKLDENTNDGGSNTDSFFAANNYLLDPVTGAWTLVATPFAVDANDGDHFETFPLAGNSGSFGTGTDNLGPTGMGTQLTVPPAFAANAPLGVVEAADPTTHCAGGVSCFGALATVTVANGSNVSPYIEWRIRWDISVLPKTFSKSGAGVVHFLDSGPAVPIYNTKKYACSASKPVDCVVSATLTKTYFEIIVRTLSNGGMKGFG